MNDSIKIGDTLIERLTNTSQCLSLDLCDPICVGGGARRQNDRQFHLRLIMRL